MEGTKLVGLLLCDPMTKRDMMFELVDDHSRFAHYVPLFLKNSNIVDSVFCVEYNGGNVELSSLIGQSCLSYYYEDPFLKPTSLGDRMVSFKKTYLSEGTPPCHAMRNRSSKFLEEVDLFDDIVMYFHFINFYRIDHVIHYHLLDFHCASIKPFNGVGIFYGNLVKDFASYGIVLNYKVKKCLSSCYTTPFILIVHMDERNGETSFGVLDGFNPPYCSMIFYLFSQMVIGTRKRDLRANPFQGGEDDMTTGARHRELLHRREPWVDWGPRMREKARRGPKKARWKPAKAQEREGSDLRSNPFQEGEDDTIIGAEPRKLEEGSEEGARIITRLKMDKEGETEGSPGSGEIQKTGTPDRAFPRRDQRVRPGRAKCNQTERPTGRWSKLPRVRGIARVGQ